MNTNIQFPQLTRIYQNHMLDSTRWQHYQPRPDDIIISTAYKSGTTWLQEIVRQLIFAGQTVPERDQVSITEISPWLDCCYKPMHLMLTKLETQQHRRFIKSHLPLDGVPFYPQVKYIVGGRDTRDVAMSLWNHYANYTPEVIQTMAESPARVGDPLPLATNIHDFWRNWITRGTFEWEREGYPYWGNLHHTQTWWIYRHLPNIHFVHYNDLTNNFVDELQRLATFLEIPLSDETLPAILYATRLEVMRENAARLDTNMKSSFKFAWKEGAKTFFYKGTNGRWKDVLSAEELSWYDETASNVLSPDCRAWLEQGRVAFDTWSRLDDESHLGIVFPSCVSPDREQ